MKAPSVGLPMEELNLDVDTDMTRQRKHGFEGDEPNRLLKLHLSKFLWTLFHNPTDQLPGAGVGERYPGFGILDHVRVPNTRHSG